jgi:hypothetical protein
VAVLSISSAPLVAMIICLYSNISTSSAGLISPSSIKPLSDVVVCACVSCCCGAELDVPEVLGREFVAMTRLQRQAADAFGVLETLQANKVRAQTMFAGLLGQLTMHHPTAK